MGVELGPLLREEHEFEGGSKHCVEVTGGWRKMHTEEPHNLYCLSDISCFVTDQAEAKLKTPLKNRNTVPTKQLQITGVSHEV
jgi:hypothetical protein